MEETTAPPVRIAPIDRNRELLKAAREEVYKKVGDIELRAYIWEPPEEKRPTLPMAAAAFFFSSGWDNGQVSQFAPHSVYFASRGMLCIAFEYRVANKHHTTPLAAVADARDAMLWLRLNAEELFINPCRIVGVGGSGGAHAIASASLLATEKPVPGGNGLPVGDPAANALVLFNPVLDTSKSGFGFDRFPDPASAKAHNLIRAIRRGMPPTLIMHGTADRVVPFQGSQIYAKKCARKKNTCRLIEFEGAGHGFFNFNLSFERYEATLMAMDDFLVELGYLEPDSNTLLGGADLL